MLLATASRKIFFATYGRGKRKSILNKFQVLLLYLLLLNLVVAFLFLSSARAAENQNQNSKDTGLSKLTSLGQDPRISRKIPESKTPQVISVPTIREVKAPTEPRHVRLQEQEAVVYPNIQMHPSSTTTQSEMSIWTHPINPDVVMAGANAVHTSVSVGSQGWYYTTNGGASWTGGDTLPTHSNLSLFMSDPAVGIDLDGNLFFNALLFGATGDLILARSTDNGSSWSQVSVPNATNGEDKNHLAIDINPGSPFENNLYTAYTDFEPFPSPVMFSRSTNRGVSFSNPISISGSIGSQFAQGINLAVGPNSELYATWSGYDSWPPPVTTRLGFNKSTDGGVTWQTAQSIRSVNDIRGTLNKGGNFVRVNSFPSMAVDRSTGPRQGWIYIVYPEKNPTTPDIFLVRSTDGGSSWSSPIKVNQDNSGKDQWFAWITVDPITGILYVVYYDSRNFPANDSAQVYISSSLDGGVTFEPDVLVSDVAFLPTPIPGLASGYMGDYIGISAVNGVVWPCWNDNRTGIHQAYTSRIEFIEVGGPPKISVSPETLDFGEVYLGYPETSSINVRNLGFPETLSVTDIQSNNSDFTPGITAFLVPGGSSRNVKVAFDPSTTGLSSGTLTISSNDTTNPTVEVTLLGNGLIPPDISVSPESLSADLFVGGMDTETLTISNSGGSDLDFEISIADISGGASVRFIADESDKSAQILAVGKPVSLEALAKMHSNFPQEISLDLDNLIDKDKPFQKNLAKTIMPPKVAGVEVFGNKDNIFFAGPRTRGNLFTCTTSVNLVEHRFYLNPSASTQLWFLVYEGSSQTGIYNLISASDVSPAGLGEGWYSSGNINAPLVAGKYYLIVASFEQPGNYYNQQNISPYPITTSFGKLTAGAGWNWAPTSNFPPDTVQDVPSSAFGDPVAYYQTLVTSSWVSANPNSGTIPAGNSMDIEVTFDATGLNGGNYDANILISSNDPDEPQDTTPVHLHVTGAPDIAVSDTILDYGSVFIGASPIETLVVSNEGTDLLTVSDISSDNPNFTANFDTFSLNPGQKQNVLVTFTPPDTALFTGNLTISSNDPDEPNMIVSLLGIGLLPPDIAVTPESLSADLFTGEMVIETLTIDNTGFSDLKFEITVEEASALAFAKGNSDDPRQPVTTKVLRFDPTTYRILNPPAGNKLTRDEIGNQNKVEPFNLTKELSSGALKILLAMADDGAAFIAGQLLTYPDIASVDIFDTRSGTPTLAMLSNYDAVMAWTNFTPQDAAALGNVLADYVDQGGGVVLGAFSFYSNCGFYSMCGRIMDTSYTPLVSANLGNHRSTANMVILDPSHPIMAGVTSASDYYRDYTILTGGSDLIAKWSDGENFVAAKGGVVAINSYVGQYYQWTGDIPLIVHNSLVFAASGGVGWLAVAPDSGTIPAGDSMDIEVTFDATGLNGGDYYANILISSNDPDEQKDTTPVHLHVTGAPDIAVSKDTIDYGSLFIGASVTETVVVSNEGTDLLTVSNITSDNPDYTVNITNFSLNPNQSQNVIVTFTPPDTGLSTGQLTIISDDPDEDTVIVFLQGKGLLPPDISVSPESLSADLFTGEMVTETLTISNTGFSDLAFDLLIENVVVASQLVKVNASRLEPDNQSKVSFKVEKNGPESNIEIINVTGKEKIGFYADTNRTKPSIQLPHEFTNPGKEKSLNIGDILGTYANFPYANTGMVWVGTDLYVVDYDNDSLRRYDIQTQQVVAGYSIHNNPYGIAWDGQYLWIGNDVGNVYGYDLNGNNIGSFSSPVNGYTSLTRDGQYFIVNNAFSYYPTLYRVDYTGTIIQTYTSSYPGYAAQTVWVPQHSDGHLWANDPYYGKIVQFSLANGVASVVREFYFYGNYYSYSIGHNGIDLWWSDWDGPLYQIDDGIKEWLSANPTSDTIPAGSSMDIAVTFDATGLNGGDYYANILISSNDPDEPQDTTPVHLHVTGAPDIAVSDTILDYGSVFIGASPIETLVVSNEGTDLLTVSDISSDNPNFTVNIDTFSLNPGQKKNVLVTFTPPDTGLFTGNLTISSNDPDEPSVMTSLRGIGLLPPDISVTPESLSADLFTGEMTVETLTISNTGFSDLNFDISTEETTPLKNTPVQGHPAYFGKGFEDLPFQERLLNRKQPLSESHTTEQTTLINTSTNINISSNKAKNVLIIQNNYPWGFAVIDSILIGLGVNLSFSTSSNFANLNLSQFGLIILPSVQTSGNFYTDIAANIGLLESYVSKGGVLEYHATTQGTNTVLPGGGNSIFSTDNTNLVAEPTHPIVQGVPGTVHGTAASHNYLTGFTAGATVITTNQSNLATTIDYKIGNGHCIVTGMTWEFAYNYGWDYALMLPNALAYSLSLAGVSWISTNPSSGTVPAGSSMEIEVKFDATGLNGGDYYANILISSNDPDEPQDTTPVHLHVTGAPDIAVSDTILDYGSVFIGASPIETLVVSNEGTDLLTVSDISSDNPNFTANFDTFSLNPGQKQNVLVTFTPPDTGLFTGHLSIISNDPDEDTLMVFLQGEGLLPPKISVSPDSFVFGMSEGDSTGAMMKIQNTGFSDLNFDISIVNVATGSTLAKVNFSGINPAHLGKVDFKVGENELQNNLNPKVSNFTGKEKIGFYADKNRTKSSIQLPQQFINPGNAKSLNIGDILGTYSNFTYGNTGMVWVGKDLYVVDFNDADLRRYDIQTQQEVASYNIHYNPYGIAWDGQYLWIGSDSGNVYGYDLNGNNIGSFSSPVYNYTSLTWDGQYFIVNYAFGFYPTFYRVDYTGTTIETFTSSYSGYADQTVWVPQHADGHLWGNNPYNGKIVQFSLAGGTASVVREFYFYDNNYSYSIAHNGIDLWWSDWDGPLYQIDDGIKEWLSTNPTSDTVPAGDSVDVMLEVNAKSLIEGEYQAILTINNNDPTDPQVPVPVTLKVVRCIPGDVNSDGGVTFPDIIFLVNYVFKGGHRASCRGDVNADGKISLGDIVYLVNYLFKEGWPDPINSPGCCGQ